MRRVTPVLGLFCALMACSGTARAQDNEGVTGQELLKIVEAVYPGAELTQDDAGDPMISASTVTQDFIILTQGCNDADRCAVIRMITGWEGPYGAGTIADINSFHADQLFGRAFLDTENDLTLEWNLTAAGAPDAYLRSHVETWGNAVIPIFLDRVVYGGKEFGGTGGEGQVRPVSLSQDALTKKAVSGVYKAPRLRDQGKERVRD